MILLERVLFYPAALAATVFVLRLAYQQPGPAAFTAVGALGVLWILVAFKIIYRTVKVVFWLAIIVAAVLTLWFRTGGFGF